MKLRTVAGTLLAVLVFPFAAGAQTNAPPKPDFASMDYFVGLWNCTHVKDPDPSLVGTKFSFAGATDPGGYWEVLDLQNGRINITRDGPDKQWTFIYLGNGGDYSVMTTPGWNGNTLTLKEIVTYGDEPHGQAQFVKVSDSQYRAIYSDQTPSGPDDYQIECTRAK